MAGSVIWPFVIWPSNFMEIIVSLEIAGGVVWTKILQLVEFWYPPSKISRWPQRKVTGCTLAQNELKNRFMMFSESLDDSLASKMCSKDCLAASFGQKPESTFHGNLKNPSIPLVDVKFQSQIVPTMSLNVWEHQKSCF